MFYGVITDAAGGLPLRSAMTWFADDAEVARNYSRIALRRRIPKRIPGSFTGAQLAEMDANRRILLRGLVEKLRNGKLLARTFQNGSLVNIPAEWWTGATLDADENFAEARGVRLVGVLVFDAAPPQPAAPVVKIDPSVWLREHMRQTPKPTRKAAMKACRDATHVTYREALAAWMALPDELRRHRGRPSTQMQRTAAGGGRGCRTIQTP